MSCVIYLRTSTEDQTPELQLNDCKSICEDENPIILVDKQSAWKEEKERPNFEKLKNLIKTKKVSNIVVWDLDRIYRNRKKLIEFFEFCKLYKVKIHSFRQEWLEQLNNIPDPFNEIMHSLMLNIMGWLAEEESTKKSARIKMAITKKSGKAYSKYGNKWGRKSLSNSKKKKILELHNKGMSLRAIAKEVGASVGAVHKTLSENQVEKTTKNACK